MDIILTTKEDLQALINEGIDRAMSKYIPAPATPAKEFYSEKELRAHLGIKSRSTIIALERKGVLTPVILNRAKKYSAANIAALIANNTLKQRQ